MARSRTLTLKAKVEVENEEKLRALGRTMQNVGRAATTFLTLPILGAGAAAIKFASDLEEATNKAVTVFGDASAAIVKESENMNDAFSQAEFLDLSGTFGALLKNMEFTTVEAQRMSTAWLDLAADMASFHNVDPTEAIQAIQSALTGEFTPLKRFGVALGVATIEAKALEMGLWDGTGAIDANTKALVIQSELIRQQPDLIGDWDRTLGGAANQQRLLTKNFQDAAAALGQELLPVATEFITMVNGWIKAFKDLSPETRKLIVQVAGITAALGPLLFVVGSVVRVFAPFHKLLTPLPGLLAKFSTAIGVSRLALIGWIGVIGAAGVAVGQQYGEVLEGLSGQILRDFAKAHGIAADEVTSDVARIAESLGVDIPEAQERLLAAMDGNAEAYDRVVRGMTDSTNAATGEISEALLGAGSDWEEYQNQISGAMFDEPDGVVPTIGRGVDAMADEVGTAPGRMADELLAAQFRLTDATAQLVEFMEQALSPTQEIFQLQGFLASQELANALTDNNALIRQKAGEMQQAAVDRLAEIRSAFLTSGASSGYSFGQGLSDPAVLRFVSGSAARLAAAARGIFPSSEPKDPRSPLRGITKGFGFGDIFAKGLLTGESAVQGAFRSLVSGGIGALPSLSPLSGGGAGVTNIFNLRWDGEPPKGRNEEEIIGNLQRLSPLVGNALVGGS